jgi:DTW domain-containing protein YfiP
MSMSQARRPASSRRPAPRRAALIATEEAGPLCPRCEQPESICICHDIVPIEHRVEVLILQHPQERKEVLSTARLASLGLAHASFKVGLSWRSLSHALGREVEARRWAVLYLGSAKPQEIAKGSELVVLDAKRKPLAKQPAALAEIEGIVLLDGTWSQAKTLWWRNAWMLKCRSLVLGPRQQSRYGKLRREPRRDALSTLEAAALALSRLENRPEIESGLNAHFQQMLDRYQAAQKSV